MEDDSLYDITPDKSLVKKIGKVGYRTEQAIAELVDNAIDARFDDKTCNIAVKLDFKWRRILVEDDGVGMNGDELADAMTIAKETHTHEARLGQFGMGMKSACSSLGRRFEVVTSKIDSDVQYTTEYDEKQWMSDKSQGWRNFRVRKKTLGEDANWHGTKISVSDLLVPLYPNQASNFKKNFGIRYSPYIGRKQISLCVNTLQCSPVNPDVEPGSRTEIHIPLNHGNQITGHIELLRRRSIKGNYGFHLFWNGRLIQTFVKFGFLAHPENARIVGSINLNHVPVNYTKSGFLENSGEYAEAYEKFADSQYLKDALHASSSEKHTDIQTVKSVFESVITGAGTAYATSRRVNMRRALDQITATEPFTLRCNGRRMEVEVERSGSDSPLYVADVGKDATLVSINAESDLFLFQKNPMVLVGMIASESALLGSHPDVHGLLAQRNLDMSRFVKAQQQNDDSAHQHPMPDYDDADKWRDSFQIRHDYTLASELVEAHDMLVEEHDARFQFTALSTLSPYMHDLGGKLVYTVHTLPSNGEMIVDILSEKMGKEFVVVDRPSSDTIKSLVRIPHVERVLAVREHAAITGSTVASPAKAFCDLLAEVFTHKIILDDVDARRILQNMMRLDVVDMDDLKKYTKIAKRTRQLDRLLEEAPLT